MIADQMFSVGIAVVAVYAVAVGIALVLGMGKTPRRELGMILVNAAKRSAEPAKPGGFVSRRGKMQSFGDVVYALAAARRRAKTARGCRCTSTADRS
ncbi:hypothetical protein [Haloferula sp. BvORR071]|uniref:hypothetical protein n=1 Tax=Haloferula sp. BvORR071 TaxID=1396141 RepID=UPI002240EFF7|nr:hypothetical protein [Haloferula sp. BvORR071]